MLCRLQSKRSVMISEYANGDPIVEFDEEVLEDMHGTTKNASMRAVHASRGLFGAVARGTTVGRYRLLRPGVVTQRLDIHSDDVALLQPGSVVDILEVAFVEEHRRIRGRISTPPGWLSLLVVGGKCWAVRDDDSPKEV